MTRSMPSTWIPRAAMSVATMTRTAPEANEARFRSRAPCAQVAVQFGRRDAAAVELAGEPVGGMLGPGEDERPVAAARERGDHADPVRGADGQQVVDHRPGGAAGSTSCMPGRS